MLQRSPNYYQRFAIEALPPEGDDRHGPEPYWSLDFKRTQTSTIRVRELRARKHSKKNPLRHIPYFYLRDSTCIEIEASIAAKPDDRNKPISDRLFKQKFADEVRRLVEEASEARKRSRK